MILIIKYFNKAKLITLRTFFLFPILHSACVPSSVKDSREAALQKIKFDLNEIDENGMIGPPDGKRSVAYEFCIPLDKRKRKEVSRIDPSVKFFNGPGGRVGCSDDQYLCIGEGGSRDVIIKLARLSYVQKIYPFYGE